MTLDHCRAYVMTNYQTLHESVQNKHDTVQHIANNYTNIISIKYRNSSCSYHSMHYLFVINLIEQIVICMCVCVPDKTSLRVYIHAASWWKCEETRPGHDQMSMADPNTCTCRSFLVLLHSTVIVLMCSSSVNKAASFLPCCAEDGVFKRRSCFNILIASLPQPVLISRPLLSEPFRSHLHPRVLHTHII